MREFFFFGELGIDDGASAGADLSEKLWQTVITLWTDDEIDDWRASDNLTALRLGDTTGNSDDGVAAGAAPLIANLPDTAKL